MRDTHGVVFVGLIKSSLQATTNAMACDAVTRPGADGHDGALGLPSIGRPVRVQRSEVAHSNLLRISLRVVSNLSNKFPPMSVVSRAQKPPAVRPLNEGYGTALFTPATAGCLKIALFPP